MNPLTDRVDEVKLPDGRTITAITPGGLIVRSKNWRLTEDAFRRYEAHIRAALDVWPQETAFDIPAGMSPNTFCHRLRDAIQALTVYKYDLALYNRLASVREELVVSMNQDGSQVWIRAKGQQGRPVKVHLGQTVVRNPTVNAPNGVRPTPNAEQIRAICLLLVSGQLDGPYLFRGRLDPALLLALEIEYDVGFAYDEAVDTTTVL